MKKAVKSYLAFSSLSYRIVCMVIMPILELAITGFVLAVTQEYNGIYPEYLMFTCAVACEIVLDFWMLGGICCREGNGLEYVKTSEAGMSVLKECAAIDLLRRFVCLMGFGLFCFAFTGDGQDLVTALAAYLVVAAALNVSRHFVLWQAQILVCVLASVLFAMLAILCWHFAPAALASELAVLGVFAAAASIASVWHVGYCMKGSYYEKGFCEKSSTN